MTAAVGAVKASIQIEVVWAVTDVDFSGPITVKLASGLLHGFSFGPSSTVPPSALISPLNLGYWRSIPAMIPISTAKSFGARYDIALSDLWGYPLNNWPNGKPWLNLPAYGAFIAQVATQLNGSVDYWEVWNEPDITTVTPFWDGTETQFFDTYLAAYTALRSVLGPDALIVGPSIALYDQGFLDRFAAYCIANHCEANVLSWHEGDAPTANLAARIMATQARYGLTSSNAALNVKEIHINEYNGPGLTHKPVDSLLYLQYFEQAGVDAVARACWADITGASECYNNTLDGLITPVTFNPRSVWHAYRLYAQGVAGRTTSKPSRQELMSIASVITGTGATSPTTMSAQVLTGASNAATLPATKRIGIRFHGISSVAALAGKPEVSMQLMKVSNSEEQASTGPVFVAQQMLAVTGDTASTIIEGAEIAALYQVVLLP
ncbi:MAG: hypothetical protein HY938_00835 [Nitrosomonadales bacterium]|nr:hypothetical protein [Nitrosomonadales bacterium]